MLKYLWNATKMVGWTIYYPVSLVCWLALSVVAIVVVELIGVGHAVYCAAADGLNVDTMKDEFKLWHTSFMGGIGEGLIETQNWYQQERLNKIGKKEDEA